MMDCLEAMSGELALRKGSIRGEERREEGTRWD